MFTKKKMNEKQVFSRKRILSRRWEKIVFGVSLIFSVFNVLTLVYFPISTWIHLSLCLGFAVCVIFITFKAPFENEKPTFVHIMFDGILICLAIIAISYYAIQHNEMLFRVSVFPTFWDIFFSVVLVIVVLEATRRASSGMLAAVCCFFLAYALWGHLLAGPMGHSGFSPQRIFTYMAGDNGIWGVGIAAASSVVFLFVLFGEFLNQFGGGSVFIELATGLAGHYKGGPAKIAVLSSALFGTISGSSIANVAATGTFTIPLMKKNGYRPEFAGGLVAAASTGGLIMPPVMGATAFVMSEIIGISYSSLAIRAFVPACMYFFAIWVMVDCEASRSGMQRIPKEELPSVKLILRTKGLFLLPIVVVFISLLVVRVSTNKAALYGILSSLLIPFLSRKRNFPLRKLFSAMSKGGQGIVSIISACSAAGLVVGVLALTGLGMKIAAILIQISKGSLIPMLLVTMGLSILLGMGLSALPAYIIASSVVVPILTEAGLDPFTAHMFIFYYSILAVVTPPVALASYAAAGIANANITRVGIEGVKMASAGLIVPFMFVYNPTLLLVGEWYCVIWSIITALIGVLCLGCTVQGYLLGEITYIQRLLLFGASFMMIQSGIVTDALGVILLVVTVMISKSTRRNATVFLKECIKIIVQNRS